MTKYKVKFYSSKEGKVVEKVCTEFTFSDNLLYFYLEGTDDICHSLHGVKSYMVSLNEDFGHRFSFGGFQPFTNKDGTVSYDYRMVELTPIKEPPVIYASPTVIEPSHVRYALTCSMGSSVSFKPLKSEEKPLYQTAFEDGRGHE